MEMRAAQVVEGQGGGDQMAPPIFISPQTNGVFEEQQASRLFRYVM